MNYKKLSIYTYLVVLFACIYSCSDYLTQSSVTEFSKSIDKLKYQLSYNDVYSASVIPSDELNSIPTVGDNIQDDEKVIYLTFDDGPSERTIEILDLLAQYNIKATFFVIVSENSQHKEILNRAYDEGHTIGVHSTTHAYKKIYKNVDSYISDFEACFNYIKEITGKAPTIFRFPGGSINSFNKAIRTDLVTEMTRRGFKYFDWNVSTQDATKSYSTESIYENIISGCKNKTSSVVLMHDSANKKPTVEALRKAIPVLIENGYTFKALDENIKPVVFKIN